VLPEEGSLATDRALAGARLATLPDDGPRGRFFDDNGAVPW
jgi:hypothetical protein